MSSNKGSPAPKSPASATLRQKSGRSSKAGASPNPENKSPTASRSPKPTGRQSASAKSRGSAVTAANTARLRNSTKNAGKLIDNDYDNDYLRPISTEDTLLSFDGDQHGETPEQEPIKQEDPVVEHVKHSLQLNGYRSEMWNDGHEGIVKDFITHRDKKILIFFVNKPLDMLVGQYEVPPGNVENFIYFIKSYYGQDIDSVEAFTKYVQFGNFSGRHLANLLRLSSGLYAPIFFGNNTWPDSKFSFQLESL
jgi:hypothetical protein